MSRERFRSGREDRYTFTAEYLVVCPRCEKRARVRGPDNPRKPFEGPMPRFSCLHCGLSRVCEPREDGAFVGPWTGAPHDGYFLLPLWLQTRCCGHTLWANNAEHLAFLEGFVGALHRERRPHAEWGWSNQSLASRLPRWMQSAGNREEVLRGIAKLKEKLAAEG